MKNANFNAYNLTEAPATFIDYIQRQSEYLPNAPGLNRIDDHVLYYQAVFSNAETFRSFSVLRFEDVKANPIATMLSLLAHLRIKRPLDAVRTALAASDVSAAKAVEELANWYEGRLEVLRCLERHRVTA